MVQYAVAIRKNDMVHGEPAADPEIGKDGLGCYFYQKFKENANLIFQVHATTGETETYSSVLRRAVRVALEMETRGLTQDDVVAMCSENSMDAFLPIFAAQLLNIKIACFDASLSVRDTIYLLKLTKPKVVFVGDAGMEVMRAALSESDHRFELVAMNNSTNNPFCAFLKPHPDENDFQPKPPQDRNHTAMILFSSGTTGLPKGICCSGYGLLQGTANAIQSGLSCSVGLHVSSFYWISALMVTLMVIMENGRKVILPKYHILSLFEAIQKYKVSYLFIGTISLNDFTEENLAAYDFSSVKNFTFGGSSAREEQLLKCRKYFRGAFVCSYGQTEASGFLTTFTIHNNDLAKKYVGSVGLPIPGTTMKIVDPETEELLGVNKRGEIRFLSKYRFVGYYNADCSTEFDKDGFLKSGDIGYFNEDNCLFICDRLKDMMKYRDWHVVPASVEKIIYLHPAVLEAVVLGIPHPEDGDHPLACIVLRDEFRNTKEEEILKFVNDRVLDREKLRAGIKFLTQIPKTPTGKIIRRDIKKAILEGIF